MGLFVLGVHGVLSKVFNPRCLSMVFYPRRLSKVAISWRLAVCRGGKVLDTRGEERRGLQVHHVTSPATSSTSLVQHTESVHV